MNTLLSKTQNQTLDIKTFFQKNGYYVAKSVYSSDEIRLMEMDFDRIVTQLLNSGENVNARWPGAAMERMGAKETVIFHTHNVQCFSSIWLQAF